MVTVMILTVVIASMGSIFLASLMLKLNDNLLQKLIKNVNAFAGGTLLGAAFIGMLPKAFSMADAATVSYVVLSGIVFFFVVEKIMLWRFCSNPDCDRHNQAGALMLLFGGGFHSMLDGIIIAAAFFHSSSFGLVVSISIFTHEIARQIGNFGVLLKAGYSKRKALAYNIAAGLMAIVGAGIAYLFAEKTANMLPYIFAFSAAGFIYVSLADLIPELHRKTNARQSVLQFILLIAGISVIIISIITKP
jgi:zinc and cadmium transporter